MSSANVARGKRKKLDQDGLIPSDSEPVEDPDFSGEGLSEEFRKSWARLIPKVYEVDPLTYPKCSGVMKVISVIEDNPVESRKVERVALCQPGVSLRGVGFTSRMAGGLLV